jgi:hypothetical protein
MMAWSSVCDDYFRVADQPGLISWRPELKYLVP